MFPTDMFHVLGTLSTVRGLKLPEVNNLSSRASDRMAICKHQRHR